MISQLQLCYTIVSLLLALLKCSYIDDFKHFYDNNYNSAFRDSVDKRQKYISQSCINDGGKDVRENCLMAKSGDMFTFIKGSTVPATLVPHYIQCSQKLSYYTTRLQGDPFIYYLG